MTEQYVGPSAMQDSEPAAAPGQLRARLVLDDDGDLSRRQVGRAGVSGSDRTATASTSGATQESCSSRRGDNRAWRLSSRLPIWTAYAASERRGGQGP